MKQAFLFALVLLIGATLCKHQVFQLSSNLGNDENEEFYLGLNDTFSFQLNRASGTGYEWEIKESSNVKLLDEQIIKANNKALRLAGGNQFIEFRFEKDQSNDQTAGYIEFELRRPWESKTLKAAGYATAILFFN